MTVSANTPRLQKFGASSAGSTSLTVLIGPVTIDAAGSGGRGANIPSMTDFGASVASGGASSVFQLQISNDGTTWTEIERIEIPSAGVVSITYGKAIPICGGGQQFRVIGTQSTAARMSAKLFGYAAISDITDL